MPGFRSNRSGHVVLVTCAVCAYVTTSYAKRTAAEVKRDIDREAESDPSLVEFMRDRNAANIFMTDATMPNPYNRLPVYFDHLCELVADVNRSQ